MFHKTCWVLSEGHAGMQNQCIGLAEALGLQPVVKRLSPRAPWKYLPARWWLRPLGMAAPETPLTPPWPDVLITCGRRSVAAALAIRHASGGKTFTIHIQDPHVDAALFDVLVVPEHDALRAGNLIVVRGAMHHVTAEKLQAAGNHFAPVFAHLRRPLVAVLIGGSNRRQELTPALIATLGRQLAGLDAGLAITPSRRTGQANEDALRQSLQGRDYYMWDGRGENPYFGLLALADAIIATSDSVSMVTEACITGKPVYIYEVPGASKRLLAFQSRLIQDGNARIFNGGLDFAPVPRLDETARAAALIRPRLEQKWK